MVRARSAGRVTMVPGTNGKQFAIDHVRACRFGGASGEIHVYDDAGENVVQTIQVKGAIASGV